MIEIPPRASTWAWSGSTCPFRPPLAYYTLGGWKRSAFGDATSTAQKALDFTLIQKR